MNNAVLVKKSWGAEQEIVGEGHTDVRGQQDGDGEEDIGGLVSTLDQVYMTERSEVMMVGMEQTV